MGFFETGLRGGAIALLALLAITGWRDARREPAARLTVLLDLCAVAYLIESAPGLRVSVPFRPRSSIPRQGRRQKQVCDSCG